MTGCIFRPYITWKRSMCCGRIAVEGEAEEITVSPRRRSRQKHGKRCNPYSTIGLEKFESVSAQLSARREYIAKKTGVPEAVVRFTHSKNGWIPVVLISREGIANKNSGAGAAGASFLGPVEENNVEEATLLRRKVEENEISVGSETLTISVFHEKKHTLVIPSSRFLKTPAMSVLGVYAMWVISSATAMAVGSVMSLKKFILNGISYFAAFFKSPRAMKPKDVNSEHEYHQHNSRSKTARMDNQLGTRPARPASRFDSFYRRTSPAMAYDASVGAIIMSITLLCLIFYGRLFAIFLWLYLILIFREGSERNRGMKSNKSRIMDLEFNTTRR